MKKKKLAREIPLDPQNKRFASVHTMGSCHGRIKGNEKNTPGPPYNLIQKTGR